MRVAVKVSGKGLVYGIITVVAICALYMMVFVAAILASAVIIDALWHLGRWLLGW
jgi:hypothetical protein